MRAYTHRYPIRLEVACALDEVYNESEENFRVHFSKNGHNFFKRGPILEVNISTLGNFSEKELFLKLLETKMRTPPGNLKRISPETCRNEYSFYVGQF